MYVNNYCDINVNCCFCDRSPETNEDFFWSDEVTHKSWKDITLCYQYYI